MDKLLWCNTHQRRSYECTYKGGIAMPCVVVDLTDELELIEKDENLDPEDFPEPLKSKLNN